MFVTVQDFEAQMPDASQLLSDEPEMESSAHYMQLLLLVSCLEWLWRDENDFFIGANLTIYFSRQQLKNREFRGPDFFVVKDTEKRPRNSWVVWEEDGRYPDLIIELLSDSTAKVDRNLKKTLYESRFHTPEYFWFSPKSLEFNGLNLVGNQYQEIVPNQYGWRWSQVLGLYLGVENGKLRYFTSEGDLVLTPEETATKIQQQVIEAERRVEAAQQQAMEAERRVEAAQQQAMEAERQTEAAQQQVMEVERQTEAAQQQVMEVEGQLATETEKVQVLAAHLRSLGIDPDTITSK